MLDLNEMASEQQHTEKKAFLASIKYSFAANLASMGLLYLTQFLLARIMKVDQYGIYAYSMSWLTLLLIIGSMGLDAALLRYIPQYIARSEWSHCRGIIKKSYRIVFPVSIILLLGAWTAILLNRSHPSESDLTDALLLGMCALPFWTAIKLTQGILQALKRPGLSQLLDGVLSPVLLLLTLGIALISDLPVSAIAVMAIFLVSRFIVLIFGLALLRSHIFPDELKSAEAEYKSRDWLKYAAPMLLIAGTQVIMNNADVIMIGMIKDPSQAGIYSAAARLAALISVSLLFVNLVLTPYISEYYYSERRVELQHFISLSARIAAFFGVPLFLVMLAYGKYALGFFGSEFKDGYYALLILSVGQLVNVLSGSVGYIMTMTGRQKQAAYVLAISAALNIVMNYMLIPHFGIEGAAIATAVSLMLWNIALILYIRKKINLNSTMFPGRI